MMEFMGAMMLIWIICMILAVAIFVFWVWMLVDCLTRETDEGNSRLIWVLVIVFTYIVGALIYFFVRRRERIEQVGR